MTIERGRPWGEPGALAPDGVLVRSDSAARRAVETARRRGERPPMLGLLRGDLARTLGATADLERLRDGSARVLPVDLGSALLDGRQHWFVAHLVARRSWWHGRVVVAMNAEWIGRYDVAPASHPNDGRLDVIDTEMGLADRVKAWRRLPTGTHLPHPGLVTFRGAAWQASFRSPLRVWLDGDPCGEVHELAVRVEPDAVTVVV